MKITEILTSLGPVVHQRINISGQDKNLNLALNSDCNEGKQKEKFYHASRCLRLRKSNPKPVSNERF